MFLASLSPLLAIPLSRGMLQTVPGEALVFQSTLRSFSVRTSTFLYWIVEKKLLECTFMLAACSQLSIRELYLLTCVLVVKRRFLWKVSVFVVIH